MYSQYIFTVARERACMLLTVLPPQSRAFGMTVRRVALIQSPNLRFRDDPGLARGPKWVSTRRLTRPRPFGRLRLRTRGITGMQSQSK
jgi:hypothetical protein